ncbi:MAG: hypothetical protein AAFX94_02145 [Myxococcota bacterium]
MDTVRIVTLALGALCGCVSPPTPLSRPVARADDLALFTRALRDRQPDDPFVAVYRYRDAHLVWVAAKHAVETASPTFQLIRSAYQNYPFDTVIVEGCPTSWGPNAPRLIDYVRQGQQEESAGHQPRGEIVPTVIGAQLSGATLLCGEPDDLTLRARLVDAGIHDSELLGFYTLRSVPQWQRERRVIGPTDPRIDDLLTRELETNRRRLGLAPDVLPGVEDWRRWYANTNRKPFGAGFQLEETGPLADGEHGTNRVAAAISRMRAFHLHELVVDRVGRGDRVLVVFGASHLMIHRPALDAVFGPASAR